MGESEEKIIEVAYGLFKQRGVGSTSLQHIASACGTNLSNINLMFKSKKDLVLAVISHTLDKKTAYLLINSALSPSAVTELNNFFKFIDDTIADLGAEILTELRGFPLALDQFKEIVDNRLIPWLQRNMKRGFSEGFYRNELDSEQYATTYFNIIRTVLESERDWSDTKKTITHINDIFLHGVLNVKGMRV